MFRLLGYLVLFGVVVSLFMSIWCRDNSYNDYCEMYEGFSQQMLSVAGMCGSLAKAGVVRLHEFVTDYLEGDSSYW